MSYPPRVRRVKVPLNLLRDALCLPKDCRLTIVKTEDPLTASFYLEHQSFDEVADNEEIPLYSPSFVSNGKGRVEFSTWGDPIK